MHVYLAWETLSSKAQQFCRSKVTLSATNGTNNAQELYRDATEGRAQGGCIQQAGYVRITMHACERLGEY